MKPFRYLFAGLFLFLLPSSLLQAATLFKDAQFKVKVMRNVEFATGAVRQPSPDKRPLLMDIYQPQVADSDWKRPALIAMHGGGFILGDKGEMTNLCREMAARGYVCFSINYRLVSDDPPGNDADQYTRTVMASVEDAGRAVRWIEQRAAEYHVDTSRLFIGGSSAGAVSSMLLAYDPQSKARRFRAVADLWGTMGSRVNWIRKGGPPLLIIHGREDQTITVSAAEEIDARARQVGLSHRTFLVEGMGHGVPLNLEIDGETLLQHLVDFFYKQIGPEGKANAAHAGS